MALGARSRAWRSQAQGRGGSVARVESKCWTQESAEAKQSEQGGFEGFAKQLAATSVGVISPGQQFWPESILKAPQGLRHWELRITDG